MKLSANKLYLIYAFLLMYAHTQARTVSGTVTDSYGNPLYGVIIKVLDNNGKTVSYAITKASGKFILNVNDDTGTAAGVVMSHKEYEDEHLTLEQLDNDCKIVMSESSTTLEEIVVMPSPIVARGDTVAYNVDAMRIAGDRSIGDVIRHLPGISIDSQGNICYQGETINKFYIEDLDMLGGYYSIATENIRADDVVSVAVYENHQPIKALKDISLSDKAAINLKLKKKAMLRPVGYVEGGIGARCGNTDWKGELYTMLIHPAMQTFISAKGTNHGGGYGFENTLRTSFTQQVGLHVENIYQLNPISMPPFESSRYTRLTSQTYSVNTGLKSGANSTISANINYSDDNSHLEGSNSVVYVTGDNTPPITIRQDASVENRISSLNAGIVFENNAPALYLKNVLTLSGSFSHGNSDIIFMADNDVSQKINKKKFSASDMFHASIRRGKKILDTYANISFAVLPDNALSLLEAGNKIRQQAKAHSLNINSGLSWGHYLNSHNQIGLSLKLNYTWAVIDTYVKDNGNDVEGFNNNQHGSSLNIDLGPYWQAKVGNANIRVDIPVNIESMRFSHLDIADDKGKHSLTDLKANVGAKLNVRYNMSNYVKSSLNIGRNMSTGDLGNFITAPIYYSYRGYYSIGSGQLNSSSRVFGNISLEYRNVMESLFGNIKIMAMRSKSDITLSSIVTDDQNLTLTEKKPNIRHTASIDSKISKIIGNATMNASVGWTLMSRKHLVNGSDMSSKSSLWNISVGSVIETLSRKLTLSPNVSYQAVNNKTSAGNGKTSDNSGNWTVNMKTSLFPISGLEISVIPSYYANSLPEGGNFTAFFLDVSTKYKFGKFQLELILSNLTDRRRYESVILTPLMKSTTTAQLKGIEGIVTLNYSF